MQPARVQTRITAMLSSMGRWNTLTANMSDLLMNAISNNTLQQLPVPFDEEDRANVQAQLNKTYTNEDVAEQAMAHVLVNIIISIDDYRIAQDKITSDLEALNTFKNAVHDILEASVLSHTELGPQVYIGERKQWIQSIFDKLYNGKANDIKTMLVAPPGTTDTTTIIDSKVSQIVTYYNNRDVANLAEILDSELSYKYPFKTIASGTGTTETITLKVKAFGVGPGTKTFFWMYDNITNSQYAWQIDGVDVDESTFNTTYKNWSDAAAATSTTGGIIPDITLPDLPDLPDISAILTGLTDMFSGLKDWTEDKFTELTDYIKNMNPLQTIADTIMKPIKMLIIVGAIIAGIVLIIIGVIIYLGYKNRQKIMDYTYGAQQKILNNPMVQERIEYMKDPVSGQMKQVGKITTSAAGAVNPVLDVVETHPGTTQIATEAGMAAATGGTSEIGPMAGQMAQMGAAPQ